MAYVSVPKDLNAVKTKVMFNLTKRQLIFFSLAGVIGLPIFFLLKSSIDITVATFAMMIVMLPFFFFAMYEKHGQPPEVIIKQIYRVKKGLPPERPYKTQNAYELLEKQYNLNKEVTHIVKRHHQTASKAVTSREKGNR
ncbi:PrgI family protein [Anaerotignum sp.]|uniref:PrgI family protein n=1 Tax=Anaerotignum sp. TaxID=2039241 RepID=UPI0028AB2F4D|nr:PrgI family protein [Anaerotignum sp.]